MAAISATQVWISIGGHSECSSRDSRTVQRRSPIVSSSGLTVSRQVKGAGSYGRSTNSVLQSRLSCRSSSYLLGSCDLGSLKVQSKESRTVVSRGPRCEATEGGGQNSKVDVWIGRAAMLGFVTAIGTEIASGKGVLANLGVNTPAPTLALALTAVVGAVLSFGVFRSCEDCLSQHNGCCSTSCSAAPRLRPLLSRHQYDRWHNYRPLEPKLSKPPDYVSRRALKRRRKERRKLLASEQFSVQIPQACISYRHPRGTKLFNY